MKRIYVADDEADIRQLIQSFLSAEGYEVACFASGDALLEAFEAQPADLLVLDIMMPGMDGVEVLKRLRSQGISTPALFLTAKTEVYQRVEGLDAGADDYLPKPFATSELLARVRAMLRRKENFVPDLLTVGDLSLNRSTYELLYHNEARSLSGREFQIMEILMQRPGFVVTTDVFLSHVWGWNSEVDISVVWVHISNIRKKLHQLHAPAEIKFIRGAGYVLEVGK